MRVGITGSSGLIGSALARALAARGDAVVRFVRGREPAGPGERRWDPDRGEVSPGALDGLDALVNLAGENLGRGRWTDAYRRRIRDSRVRGTRALCDALLRSSAPPGVLVSASALGYYGDRGGAWLDEDSPPGEGFLPELCRDWEAAAGRACEAGTRVVCLRIGVVLHPDGGALARMLRVFRIGLGGPVGGGEQFVSWVSRPDVVGAALRALDDARLAGPVNAVSPDPVPQARLAQVLGAALGRPAFLPLPGVAVRLAWGEMGEALLLHSARIRPARLLGIDHPFAHPELGRALPEILESGEG